MFFEFASYAAEETSFGDGGAWAENAWLLLVAPFLAFGVIVLFGKRLKYRGAEVAIAMMAFEWVYATVLLIQNITQGVATEHSVEVARIGGGFVLEWGWVVDGLSTMMFWVVATVSLLVFIYAVGYMRGEVRYTFFFAALSLFAGAMILLVAAPNLPQLIVGWELVGVASYLLIGHYWELKENSSAAMKAFFVNRVADIGLLIGVFVLSVAVGSFRISDILSAAEQRGAAIGSVAVAGAVLLFIGAMGKSAQFPLHVWLPDAMAGPTPVSALIHAATMVTAGVYLLARMFPLYEAIAPDAQQIVVFFGGITLLIGGLLALVQDDVKKVLAYSTVSQLGYMVAALGAGAYTAGLFHLWTHAFFKALLFLGAGSMIHAVHSNNMSDMGGLRKHMPITFWTFVFGSLALAGIPPLAGFFSKDEILAGLNSGNYQIILGLGVAGAFITAFYMTRTVALSFFGTYKGHGEPRESEKIMTVPLMVLAGLAIVGGWVNIPGVYTGFTEWVGTRAHAIVEHHTESFDLFALSLGLGAAMSGIAIGWLLYSRDAETQAARDRFRIPVLWPLLENKYYLDDLYWHGVVSPIKGPIARAVDWINDYVIDGVINGVGYLMAGFARFVYGGLDQRGIDYAIHGVSLATGASGGLLRKLQTGRVQQYAGAFVLGAVLLVVGFVFLR